MYKKRIKRIEERIAALEERVGALEKNEKETTPGMGESISFAPLITAEIPEGQGEVINSFFASGVNKEIMH